MHTGAGVNLKLNCKLYSPCYFVLGDLTKYEPDLVDLTNAGDVDAVTRYYARASHLVVAF